MYHILHTVFTEMINYKKRVLTISHIEKDEEMAVEREKESNLGRKVGWEAGRVAGMKAGRVKEG